MVLPDAALDLRPEGPLRAAQFTDEGVWAVVDLPAFGFAWVPRESDAARPPASSAGLSARGRTAQERVDRNRDRRRHRRPPQCRWRGRADGPAWPATGHDWFVRRPGQSRSLADAVRAVRRRLRRSRARRRRPSSGSLVDPQLGNSPGLVRATVSPVGRPADPRDRNHARRSRPCLAGPGGPVRPVVGLPGVPLGVARPQLDAAPNGVLVSRAHRGSSDPRRPMHSTSRRGRRRTALLFGGLPYHRKTR